MNNPDRTPFRVVEMFGNRYGHRYFREADSDRWAIADGSAAVPWKTDDGVWWVDPSRPIMILPQGCTVPLICGPDRSDSPVSAWEAMMVAHRLAMRIEDPDGLLVGVMT